MTMPSDISYANSCLCFFFILMYHMYIFALTLLIEMSINMLYICKFEQWDFVRFLQTVGASATAHTHTHDQSRPNVQVLNDVRERCQRDENDVPRSKIQDVFSSCLYTSIPPGLKDTNEIGTKTSSAMSCVLRFKESSWSSMIPVWPAISRLLCSVMISE